MSSFHQSHSTLRRARRQTQTPLRAVKNLLAVTNQSALLSLGLVPHPTTCSCGVILARMPCSVRIDADPSVSHTLLDLSIKHASFLLPLCRPWCSCERAQACPYVICLFFIPCHYYTHMVMFAFTAIWATNIHDAVPGNSEPVMGAKYHTVRDGVERSGE